MYARVYDSAGVPRGLGSRTGNLVGETGDADAPPFRVTALDLSAVKRRLNGDASLTDRLDFDRNGRVNALDLSATRSLLNRGLTALSASPGARVDDDAAPAAPRLAEEVLG